MKVKELIELLQKEPTDNDVMLYSEIDEGGGMVLGVTREHKNDPNSQTYFKDGIHPFSDDPTITDEITVVRG